MRVACRWPGGMTLVVPGPGGRHSTMHLSGPPGVQPLLRPGAGRPAGRDGARKLQLVVLGALERMGKTSEESYTTRDYGVTDVPGDFWASWSALNAGYDVLTKRVVFSL